MSAWRPMPEGGSGVRVNPGEVQRNSWRQECQQGEELGRMEVVSKPLLLRSPSAVLMKLLGNQKMGTVIFISMAHENVN